MPKVVVNTTPLIALADIGHLDILHNLYGEIMIPQAVLDEILTEPAKSIVSRCDWISVFDIDSKKPNRLYSARLHAGEIAVMMLADEQDADLLIMDDNAAKKTAKFIGFSVTGTIGVLLKAKRDGLIQNVKPLLAEMISDGFYISETIRKMVLEEAGE